MRTNNATFLGESEQKATAYKAAITEIDDEVHAVLEKVRKFRSQAAARRIPEEWLDGQWCETAFALCFHCLCGSATVVALCFCCLRG